MAEARRPVLKLAAPACIALSMQLLTLPAHAAVARRGQPVMGTVLQVTVVAADAPTAERLAEAAVAEGRHWDDVLTTWRPEGELARFNARAGEPETEVSRDLAAALHAMTELARATGGTFDPAVGPLVEYWRVPRTPQPEMYAPTNAHRIASALTLGERTAALAVGAALDAGGIGKGIALDAIAQTLRAGGAQAAFLDFGGSSQIAIGAPPGDSQGWLVVVAGLDPGVVHGVMHLRDAALSTSRASGPGSAAGPIIDPSTGAPVAVPRVVTVLAPRATTAEAWSKVPIVLGRAGVDRLKDAGLEAVYEDAAGVERTAGFALDPPPR